MFKEGDLVFATCTKNKPWPAKIIKVFDQNIYKVDFYNDNSLGIVDLVRLEPLNQTTIEFYTQKYNNKKTKDQISALDGIRHASIEYQRRQQIHKKQSQKWLNGVPTRSQKRRFESLLNLQYKRPVFKQTKIKKRLKKEEKESINTPQEAKQNKKHTKEQNIQIPTKTMTIRSKKEKLSHQAQKLTKARKFSCKPKHNNDQTEDKMKTSQLKKKKIKKLTKKDKNFYKIKKNSKMKTQKKDKSKQQRAKDINKTENSIITNSQAQNITQEEFKTLNPTTVEQNRDQKKQNQRQSSDVITEKTKTYDNCSILTPIQQNENPPLEDRLQITQTIQQGDKERDLSHKDQFEVSRQQNLQANQNQAAISISKQQQDNNQDIETIKQKKTLQDISLSNANQLKQQIHRSQQKNMEPKPPVLNNLDQSSSSELQQLKITQQINIQSQKVEEYVGSNMETTQNQQIYQQQLRLQLNPLPLTDTMDQKMTIKQQSPEKQQTYNKQELQTQKIPQQDKGIYQENKISSQILIIYPDNMAEEIIQYQIKLIDTEPQAQYQPIQEQMRMTAQIENKFSQNQASIVELLLQQSFQHLMPTFPNLLFTFINKGKNEQMDQQVSLENQHNQDTKKRSQEIVEKLKTLNRHNQSKQLDVSQPDSSFLLSKVRQIQEEEKNAYANDPQNIRLMEQGKHSKYFENMYADKTINSADFVKMARGLPELKKKLITTDKKLMAICINEYLGILAEFIAPRNEKKEKANLQMWQRQLLLGILDSDILDLKTLIEYEIMFRMMSFLNSFQKNRTSKRAQCHLEYLFVNTRLELYLSRYMAERKKGLYIEGAISYDQLFKQYHERNLQ